MLGASVRELVLNDLVAAVAGVAGMNAVTRRDVAERTMVPPFASVLEPDEDKTLGHGVYTVRAAVPIRIWERDRGDDPNGRLDAMVAAVEDAILVDRRRGGNAINTSVKNTASEVTTVSDKLTTVLDVEVTYRHSAKDPTSKVPAL